MDFITKTEINWLSNPQRFVKLITLRFFNNSDADHGRTFVVCMIRPFQHLFSYAAWDKEYPTGEETPPNIGLNSSRDNSLIGVMLFLDKRYEVLFFE